jgi:hypothetical protein
LLETARSRCENALFPHIFTLISQVFIMDRVTKCGFNRFFRETWKLWRDSVRFSRKSVKFYEISYWFWKTRENKILNRVMVFEILGIYKKFSRIFTTKIIESRHEFRESWFLHFKPKKFKYKQEMVWCLFIQRWNTKFLLKWI